MSGIRIGRAKIGNVVNIEGNVYLRASGAGLEAAVGQVLASRDPDEVSRLLEQLDSEARGEDHDDLTVERVAAEAERQLENARPPTPVAERVASIAQGAAGGVISQGVFLALRGIFGF